MSNSVQHQAPTRPSTVFNVTQKGVLDALLPEFEAFVIKHNPKHTKRCKALTDWRKSKATELMDNPPFSNMVPTQGAGAGVQGSPEYKDWHDAICRYFINYYNNKFLRAVDRPSTALSHHATGSQEKTPRDPKNSAKDFLRRAFIIFSSELTARELFAKENKERLKSKMDEISTDFPDLSGGPLRQKALKLLWKEEDQDLWEARLEELQNDVEGNQEEFEFLMLLALEDVCTRKRLGSVMMSFSYAFRDAEDGLKTKTIYAGYNAESDEVISATPSAGDQETMSTTWCAFADSQIPRAKQYVPVHSIPLNEDGRPIMPQVDISKATPEQISILLYDFLLAVWNDSSLSKSKPSIPWDQISASPESYIDQATFKLPIPLANPKELAPNPMALYTLYGYFSTISETTPFQFREAEILATTAPMDPTPASASHIAQPLQQSETGLNPIIRPITPIQSQQIMTDIEVQKDAIEPDIVGPLPVQQIAVAPVPQNVDTTPQAHVPSPQIPESYVPPLIHRTLPEQLPPPDTTGNVAAPIKAPSKRGRGRGRGRGAKGIQAPTRVSVRRNQEQPSDGSGSASALKRRPSTSDVGQPRKRVKPNFEYRDDEGNLVNKHGERIDEDGNLLAVADL